MMQISVWKNDKIVESVDGLIYTFQIHWKRKMELNKILNQIKGNESGSGWNPKKKEKEQVNPIQNSSHSPSSIRDQEYLSNVK